MHTPQHKQLSPGCIYFFVIMKALLVLCNSILSLFFSFFVFTFSPPFPSPSSGPIAFVGTTLLPGGCGEAGQHMYSCQFWAGRETAVGPATDGNSIMEMSDLITLTNDFLKK